MHHATSAQAQHDGPIMYAVRIVTKIRMPSVLKREKDYNVKFGSLNLPHLPILCG